MLNLKSLNLKYYMILMQLNFVLKIYIKNNRIITIYQFRVIIIVDSII